MSQLAFDEDGDPIELPPTATGWRVKRMRGTRGAPGLVYGADGAPLVLPLEMNIEDLRREVGIPGKYKLEAIDEKRRPLEVEEAIVFVPPTDASADEPTEHAPTIKPASGEPTAMAVVIEAMRQNSEAMKQNAEMARSIVDRFPAMIEAAAVLIKAADGAGLPAREPRKERDEGDEDDEDEADEEDDDSAGEQVPSSGFDIKALMVDLFPGILAAISKGEIKLPNLAEMLDWRRAAAKKPAEDAPPSAQASGGPSAKASSGPSAKASRGAAGKASGGSASKPSSKASGGKPEASSETGKPETSSETGAASEAPAGAAAKLPPLSLKAMAHFAAIQNALTPDEAALARAAAAQLSPTDLRAWFDQLSAMTVPEAVERVRALLAASKPEEEAA